MLYVWSIKVWEPTSFGTTLKIRNKWKHQEDSWSILAAASPIIHEIVYMTGLTWNPYQETVTEQLQMKCLASLAQRRGKPVNTECVAWTKRNRVVILFATDLEGLQCWWKLVLRNLRMGRRWSKVRPRSGKQSVLMRSGTTSYSGKRLYTLLHIENTLKTIKFKYCKTKGRKYYH